MSVKNKETLLKQIEEIFEEFKFVKKKYIQGRFPVSHYYNAEEGARIQALYTKIISMVRRFYGPESQYFIQVKDLASNLSRSNLELMIGVLTAIYDILKKGYENLDLVRPITLKFEKIIEDMNLNDQIYQDVVDEINGTYRHYYFNSMYILIRKLLENLVYDCLNKYYGTSQIELYYNTGKNRHHGFGTLIENFNILIKVMNFKTSVGDIEQKIIDWLKNFQEKGNKNAHSLFSLAHQEMVEENKDKINELIKKLIYIKEKL